LSWKAILRRDRRFDGKFVYAALTTGIYCRPSCPARHPRRRNTLIFTTDAQAEREGFTACLRCRPRGNPLSQTERGIQRTLEWIETHPEEANPLSTLSRVSGLSPNYLHQVFKRTVGMSPKEFCDVRRWDRFQRFMGQGMAVSIAGHRAGFGSGRALYEGAGGRIGMTPGVYRRGGRGVEIGYRVLTSRQGRVLIASTPKGICSVALGGQRAVLVENLYREFPHAKITRRATTPEGWIAAVKQCEAEDPILAAMRSDLRRSVFEARVWNALR
jgi:AraC family transcriptional regulator, regulatory protein of adaptative response / methylated-DNA-[protein]-cysteine methyltransferase